MFFLANLSGAYLDVLVDALMVIQSRKDEEDGSEQLQSLSWGAMGAGGMTGSLVAGFLTENYHPKWCFFWYSWMGLVVTITACFLTKESERDRVAEEEEVANEETDISTSLENYENEQRAMMIAAGEPAASVN